MKRVFVALALSGIVALSLAGGIPAVSETSEANLTIYAALIFAIIILGMLLLYLSREMHSHIELIQQIERIEEKHHNEKKKIINKKISRASEVNNHQKARRLKEIKRLVREIKRI